MPVLQALPEFHLSRSSFTIGAARLAMVMAVAENLAEPRKIGVLLIILFVSFFAVSFPSLSKHISFLRIPGIFFFIGKHFGTGVILATAFIHLLDDAFRSLQDLKVEEKYGGIKKWTGSIILASLLSIFLVEYISTSYVQRLQEKPSAPPSPSGSRPNSPSPYRSRSSRKSARSRSRSRARQGTERHAFPPQVDPNPASIPELNAPPNISFVRAPSAPVLPVRTHSVTYSHPTHHPPHHHHSHAPTIPASAIVGLPIEVLASSPRICRLALAHDHVHGHHHHLREGHSANELHHEEQSGEEDGGLEHSLEHSLEQEHEHEHEHHHPIIGRRRQVVGLLVLQLGIMIHSLVIGLTLSVTTGSDFTSLTTAIVFHQLFEGLSLGIRIAALPPKRKKSHNDEPKLADRSVNTALDYPSQSTTVVSGRSNNGIAKASPSSSTRHGDPSLTHGYESVDDDPHSTPHATPMSPKLSRMGAFSCRRWMWKVKEFEWLKPTLTFLFGVTTPFGMILGMAVWNNRASGDSENEGSMLLIQGVMSAISAGLLIYAATVEMLAADFVFGDVEGNHHHHHAHAHAHANSTDDFHGREDGHHMDEESFTDGNGGPGASVDKGGNKKKPTAVPKQILAVLSLFAGAGTMVLVGLGE